MKTVVNAQSHETQLVLDSDMYQYVKLTAGMAEITLVELKLNFNCTMSN